MTPTFAPEVTEYTATTTNATNKIAATASDGKATISISHGETQVDNGSSVTWETGVNTLSIKVKNGAVTKTYTVTVTKS